MWCPNHLKPVYSDFGPVCLQIGSIEFLEIRIKRCFSCSFSHFWATIDVFGARTLQFVFKFEELVQLKKIHKSTVLYAPKFLHGAVQWYKLKLGIVWLCSSSLQSKNAVCAFFNKLIYFTLDDSWIK